MTTLGSKTFRACAMFAVAILLAASATASAGASQTCARPNLASDDARRCIATASATSYAQAGGGSPFAACVTALPAAPPCPIDARPHAEDLSQALIYLGAAFQIAHTDDTRRFAATRRVGLELAFRVLTAAEQSRGAAPGDDALSTLRFLIARMESAE